MLKHNPSDGFGDEFAFSADGLPQKKASGNAWPKSSNWHDRMPLSPELQDELSDWIEAGLTVLEENYQDFVTVNSQRRDLRRSR